MVLFIESAGQDFLLNSRRITDRNFPPAVHVERVKFVVLFVNGHASLLVGNQAANAGFVVTS